MLPEHDMAMIALANLDAPIIVWDYNYGSLWKLPRRQVLPASLAGAADAHVLTYRCQVLFTCEVTSTLCNDSVRYMHG
jgi:hypothetical protein